jgi:hypothetical protein
MMMKKFLNNYSHIFVSLGLIILCITSLITRPDCWVGALSITISILDITLAVVLVVAIIVDIIDIVKTKKKALENDDTGRIE